MFGPKKHLDSTLSQSQGALILGTPHYKGVPKIQLGAPKPSKIKVENQPHLNPMGFKKLSTIDQELII